MRRILRRVFRSAALLVTCSITVPIAVAVTILASFLFLPLPAVMPEPKLTVESRWTRVHTVDGEEIAVFKEVEQKIPVPRTDIPEVLKQAVISAEDRNFYQHGGVDIRGSVRAFWADVAGGRVTQGGSTITQQYVKNAYTDRERTLVRKVREAILASQLERETDKDEILYRYLQTIYLGEQAYGVGAASETYFRKRVNDLTLSEAATLAGLIPAPSSWAPRKHPEDAEFHRQLVLKLMFEQRRITQEQYDQAVAEKIALVEGNGPAPANVTAVYPVQQIETKYPEFADYVQRYLVAKYGPATVFRGGLDVTVTLDTNLQNLAKAAVGETLDKTNPELQMGLVSIEPQTGYVKAFVSGRSFGAGKYASLNFSLPGCPGKPPPEFKVEVAATCWDGNTVSGGGGGRQPGSSFKAFTLAAVFSKGVTPNKVYPAPNSYVPPGCKGPSCKPIKNAADGEGGPAMTLKEATAKSVNTVFAQLIRDVGVKDTADMAKRLGVTSAWESPQVHGLSYTLGTLGVSPLEMASAYGVFANRGVRVDPVPVLLVKDPTGKVIEDNTQPNGSRVLEEIVADNVTSVLRGPVSAGGTAYPRADIQRPAAGKTGTTDNYVDAWFVGYTPTLSTSVWMGYAANETTPMRSIKGVSAVFGGTLPAQTWHNFMLPALKDVPITDFTQPAPIKPLVVDANKQARQGIDSGDRSYARDTPNGGSFVVQPPAPSAVAPTTTTIAPPPDDGGNGGDNGGDDGGGSGGGGQEPTTTTTPTFLPPRP